MLHALSEAVVDSVKMQHQLKGRVEGEPEYGWLLVDFGDVILHIFSPDRREYYCLEDLWNKAKILLHVQ